ncbi:MAG TPA: 3-methyl-2-oxobutanoate hydroxymethyltransferase [Stellaceae bacterium]|nr:3-methyl-2-oxobutanoate hydroxymethyltransferase [Stellaceae bacterium]
MSVQTSAKQRTPAEIGARKGGVPLVCLTAYTTPMARLLDPVADLLLVGDSLGMVVYGFASTLPVTLEMMIAHGAAVVRGAKQSCVIVDLPFGSYQESPAQAFRSAARVMAETGAAGVKLEGGAAMAETIRFLVERGVPVLGHIGLQPQSVHATGFRAQGRGEREATRIMADARAAAAAGAFALVIEGTVEPLARAVTEAIAVPTIGIGASSACDGQILVTEDLLGIFAEFTPRFVRRYGEIGQAIAGAAAAYAEDVKARRFPGPEHVYGAAKADQKA